MKLADKQSLLQGRSQPPWLPRCPTLYQVAIFAAIVFLCGIAGGCAEVPRVYTEGSTVFHENDLAPCERGAAACTVGMPGAWHVYYAKGDMLSLAHEREHLLGMMHGAWFAHGYDVCAKVTASGVTKWQVGALMCRRADGSFYERGI